MDELLHRILSGITICDYYNNLVYINNIKPIDNLLMYKFTNILYNTLLLQGIFTIDDILSYMIQYGLWSSDLQQELDNIPKEIEDLKIAYYNAYVNMKKRDFFPKKIKDKQKRYYDLISQRYLLSEYTCDGITNLYKGLYLIHCCATYLDGSRVFTNKIEDENYDDLVLLSKQYINSQVDDHKLRKLSKYPVWSNLWAIDKNPLNIFGVKSTSELNDEQKALIGWSQLYDSIRNSSECPSDDVIKDDDLIDGWLILQSRDRKNNNKPSLNINTKHDEIFIVTENPEDIQRINDMNTGQAKMIKQQRLSLVQKHGSIAEQNFPDSRNKILQQALSQGVS